MNTTQWTALITSDMPGRKRYGEIERVVKECLDGAAVVCEFSTKDVVEQLMPIAICRGEQIEARNELFTILMKLAKNGLADYCHKGDAAKKRFGKSVLPWIWHSNRKPVATCPHCGGVL